MKTLLIGLFSVWLLPCMSQSLKFEEIFIDTINTELDITNIIHVKSSIPQLNIPFNQSVAKKINDDLKKYFFSSLVKSDTTSLLKSFLKEYQVGQINELEDSSDLNSDEIYEFFNISYISNNFINVTVESQLMPNGGKIQSSFYSKCYDLKTGDSLIFSDFIDLNSEGLTEMIKNYGYRIDYRDDHLPSFIKINEDDEIGDNIANFFLKDTSKIRCINFYFNTINNELFLAFKFQCSGPQLIDYVIPISILKPYIRYSELKDSSKLWSEDINSLKGMIISSSISQITFDDYSIVNGGGYMLSKDIKISDFNFGVSFWYSSDSIYYLFEKISQTNNKLVSVLDILQISKKELKSNNSFVFGLCKAKATNNSGIIAIVKDNKKNPEYFRKVIKAWNANIITERFEVFDKRNVTKCYNENYGL